MEREAQLRYKSAVGALARYCDKETVFWMRVHDEAYPFRIQFFRNEQATFFDDEPEETEGTEPGAGSLTIVVGLETRVESTLRYRADAHELKKLINLTEKAGNLYYRAFCEEQTAMREFKREAGGAQ